MTLDELRARDDWSVLESQAQHNRVARTAARLGVSRDEALRVQKLIRGDEEPAPEPVDHVEKRGHKDEISRLNAVIRELRREQWSNRQIRKEAFELAGAPCKAPEWAYEPKAASGSAGIPTLFLSDLHWGEVVNPREVYGLNEYTPALARTRLRRVVESAIDLLRSHIVGGDYPGICVALGGDMVSGGIHEELLKSDELTPQAACIDLRDHLVAALRLLADEFGRVYVPCVDGNHDRSTKKPQAKQRMEHSFGWMLYCMLERAFADDDRVTIQVSEETDLLYDLAGTRYMLTHGDSMGVRGGNGIIGALGPIMRGYRKTSSALSKVGRGFDVLIMGHWHQYLALRNVRVNGTLKGYDEYARAMRFDYEPPTQSLWLTHPDHGITLSMPVFADDHRPALEAFRATV